jgi:hypothetical protein
MSVSICSYSIPELYNHNHLEYTDTITENEYEPLQDNIDKTTQLYTSVHILPNNQQLPTNIEGHCLDRNKLQEDNIANKNHINSQNDLLMNSLMDFYGEPSKLNRMISIVNGESNISLRIVDWFVTNYAKKYYTIYDIENDFPTRFKVYNDYKLKLKAYSKKRFDPFCRWERTMLPLEGNRYIETTIGQLNFFKWAIENNVIDYIENNYTDIERDMNTRNSTSKRKPGKTAASSSSTESSFSSFSSSFSSNNESVTSDDSMGSETKNKTRKKREELSISACKCIKKESVKVVVRF